MVKIDPVDTTSKTDAQIIKEASAKETIVWERTKDINKQNLSAEKVKEIVVSFPDISPINNVFVINWQSRISNKGRHAVTGEKEVFVIDYWRRRFGKERKFYFRGFLFHEGHIVGSEYQSAR